MLGRVLARTQTKVVARVLLAAATAALLLPQPAAAAHYYVALGDSLAAGFEAGPSVPGSGYVDRIYSRLRSRQHDLQLVNVACLGTTSATLQSGDLCTGAAGPQLTQAVRFLRSHRGSISLVTIDIGGNDIGASCGSSPTLACIHATIPGVIDNLRTIAVDLRAAAGRRTPIVGMNYYDPGLSEWFGGPAERALVPTTIKVLDTLDRGIATGYAAGSIAVADVEAAFHTRDLRHRVVLAGRGRVPAAVADICRWTGACEQPQNVHGTAAGYGVIAGAFWRAIEPLLAAR